jgi:diguanylate cyclase (GGDEF)-like protein
MCLSRHDQAKAKHGRKLGADEQAMADSETPPQNPGRGDSAGAPVPAQPSPQPGAQAKPREQPAPAQATQTPQAGQPFQAAATSARSPRKAIWGAVAALCVAGGVVGSTLGAHTVANNDAAAARQTSQQSSAAVTSTVKAAIQRDEELLVSTSTYLSSNSKATAREFERWAKWARMLKRYPELQQLGLVALVRAPELATFPPGSAASPASAVGATATTPATGPLTSASTSTQTTSSASSTPTSTTAATPAAAASTPAGAGTAAASDTPGTAAAQLKLVPAGTRPYYCLALANLARSAGEKPAAGLDYCDHVSGLLLSRDSGLSHATAISTPSGFELEVLTPSYKGSQLPATRLARMGAFAGWVREVLTPGVFLVQALRSHPSDAAIISYRTRTADVAVEAGTPQPGAPSTTIAVHGGWTIESFGAPVSAGVFSDGGALALLIVGCVLSVLLGLLVFMLGAGGRASVVVRVPQPRAKTPPAAPQAPSEDLHDPLTGLPNRALMLDRAECMLARAGRQSGLLVGALFIDIDWFKDVNERLGQEAGDQILKIVSERLETVVRAGDTVGRLGGGDEFVVLVETAARGARLDSLARRIVESLHKPFELPDYGPNFFLTASIGVAFGRYETPDDLLRDAQLALHAAKSAGKDRYTLFNANMRSVIEGRGVLEVELNRALAEKQFFVLYEPIYDLATGKVEGLDAVVRWLHPKQGVLLPDAFIPLAEETGLTVPIGRFVLEEACGRAATWNVAGYRVGLTIEVTANQVNRDGFVTDIRRALQQSGIEPSTLTLAIAETTVMRDVTSAVERLEEIKHLGVRIAIDDFGGSGYAYHSDLRRMPLDFLKVDRSSLAASEDEDYRTWLLEAIMIVGRDLSLTVIAKGIESREQLESLHEMGCTMAQGEFLGKPVTANDLEGVLVGTMPAAAAIAPEVQVAAGAQVSQEATVASDEQASTRVQIEPEVRVEPDVQIAPKVQVDPDAQTSTD